MLRPAVKRLQSHLCMPEQAGTQTGHQVVITQCHGGAKLLLGGTLNAPAAFTWQIQHQALGQWDINLQPDMLQPSKKGSESRQREELLKDGLEMLRLESPGRTSPLSGHSHLYREPEGKQTLGVTRVQG